MKKERVYVLDSCAFLGGFASDYSGFPVATVFEVLDEVRDPKAVIVLDSMRQFGMAIIEPSKKAIERVEAEVKKTRDRLSATDKKLVALALDYKSRGLEPVIVTDDYGVQNLASRFGIGFEARGTGGIKRVFEWKRYCPACGHEGESEECEVCGSPTRLYPRKRKRIDRE